MKNLRKLALVLPVALLSFASCSMERSYETQSFFDRVEQRRQGRVNAIARGFENIQNTIDRHLFNYSPTDPYVNFPTTTTAIEHPLRFVYSFLNRW